MKIILIRAAAISAATSVALGALGAHALKDKLSPELLQAFETGVRYQFYHSLALLAVALLIDHSISGNSGISRNSGFLKYSARLFLLGIVLFSGSLYFLALKPLCGIEGLRWIGAVTPLGGLCFIAGWILLAFSFSSASAKQS